MKGKDKCEFLKGIRKRMAEANSIPYEPRECTYEGECTGTCPYCEKEAAELLTKLKEKKAEGAEIKTDDVGILAIELGINECQDSDEGEEDKIVLTGANGTLIEQEKKTEVEELPGNLMNPVDDDMSVLPIDPFNGPNNPLMAEKELNEMQHFIHELEKPLLGDIRVPYKALSEKDKMALSLVEEELEERERKKKKMGIANKVMNRIKNALESPLKGDIDEE